MSLDIFNRNNEESGTLEKSDEHSSNAIDWATSWLDDGFAQLWEAISSMPAFSPPADVTETDDAFVVEIELPGVDRSDIDVSATPKQLVVTGERKEKERVGLLRRRTRTVGEFHYGLTLPSEFVVDDVSADLADGVLTVRLPKPETDRRRRIDIG